MAQLCTGREFDGRGLHVPGRAPAAPDHAASDREAKAVDLFIKFNELNEKLPHRREDTLESSAFWQFNALLAITESVARLTDGDASWGATVVWMLEQQQWFLMRQPIRCKSFSPGFVAQMKRAVPAMTCEDD